MLTCSTSQNHGLKRQSPSTGQPARGETKAGSKALQAAFLPLSELGRGSRQGLDLEPIVSQDSTPPQPQPRDRARVPVRTKPSTGR